MENLGPKIFAVAMAIMAVLFVIGCGMTSPSAKAAAPAPQATLTDGQRNFIRLAQAYAASEAAIEMAKELCDSDVAPDDYYSPENVVTQSFDGGYTQMYVVIPLNSDGGKAFTATFVVTVIDGAAQASRIKGALGCK